MGMRQRSLQQHPSKMWRQEFPSPWSCDCLEFILLGLIFKRTLLRHLETLKINKQTNKLKAMNSIFMSTKALTGPPKTHVLVSPFCVLPICYFGSVSLTSVRHLPKEGPHHVAHVVTHAKGQFGENVVVIFCTHVWMTWNIENAPFIEQTGKLKLSNVFVQATQMLSTAGNCTKILSPVSSSGHHCRDFRAKPCLFKSSAASGWIQSSPVLWQSQ